MSESIQVNVSDEAFELIREMADKRGLSLSSWGRLAFLNYCKTSGVQIANIGGGKRGRPRKAKEGAQS